MKTLRIIAAAAAFCASVLCLTGCTVSFVNTGSAIRYSDADRYEAGDRQISEKVDALDIEWPSGTVTVSKAKGNVLSLKETTKGNLRDELKVHSWLDGTVLRVRFCRSGASYRQSEMKQIVITVPESAEFSEVKLSCSSADAEFNGLHTAQASLSASSGNLTFSGSADRFSASSSSGKITFEGESGEISTSSSSGDIGIDQRGRTEQIRTSSSSGALRLSAESVKTLSADSSSGTKEIRLKEMPEETDLQASSGDLRLCLPEQAGFTAKISTASGELQFDLPMSASGNQTYVCGDGKNSLKISTSSGDVSILKNEP